MTEKAVESMLSELGKSITPDVEAVVSITE